MNRAYEITEKIVQKMEKAVESGKPLPWVAPFDGYGSYGVLPKRYNGEPYRGINILTLWDTAEERGYTSPYWMTFNQAVKMGACVRKGEKGSLVVYYDKLTVEDEGEEKKIPMLKTYFSFNADQIDGLEPKFYAKPEPKEPIEVIESAETFFNNLGAEVREGGNIAFYNRKDDFIQMPLRDRFRDAVGYYGVFGHEQVHRTGHPSRLNRDFGKVKGSEDYAKEEFVAELGSAILACALQLTIEPRDENAAYILSWINSMKAEPKYLFSAMAHAQKAVDYMFSLQPANDDQPSNDPELKNEFMRAEL